MSENLNKLRVGVTRFLLYLFKEVKINNQLLSDRVKYKQWNPALRPTKLYGHLVIMATFLGHLTKTTIHSLERLPRQYGHLAIMAKFFGLLVTIIMEFQWKMDRDCVTKHMNYIPASIRYSVCLYYVFAIYKQQNN